MTNNIYFIANWKMYGSTSILNSLNKLINLSKLKKYHKAKIIYFPPFTLIKDLKKKFIKSKISVGGQNCHHIEDYGSYSTYLPAERTKSLFRLESIKNNLVIRTESDNLAKKSGLMKFSYLADQAKKLVNKFSIRTNDSFLPITSLSGGNQQKVAIASAIVKDSKILLLEEPTRGVDIASKKDIYDMLRAYVKKGSACIVMCTEFPEIYELVDRCVVVSNGRIAGEVHNRDFKNIENLAKELTLLSSGTS